MMFFSCGDLDLSALRLTLLSPFRSFYTFLILSHLSSTIQSSLPVLVLLKPNQKSVPGQNLTQQCTWHAGWNPFHAHLRHVAVCIPEMTAEKPLILVELILDGKLREVFDAASLCLCFLCMFAAVQSNSRKQWDLRSIVQRILYNIVIYCIQCLRKLVQLSS